MAAKLGTQERKALKPDGVLTVFPRNVEDKL